MRNKIWPLLVALSLTLNIAFITTWVVVTFSQRSVPVHTMKTETGKIWCPLHRQLGLNDSQWNKIEPQMRTFQDSTRTLCKNMRILRAGLIDLITTDVSDTIAIKKQQHEIAKGQQLMQQMVLDHLMKEKENLTKEQWATLTKLLREQMGCDGHESCGPMRQVGCSKAMMHLSW